MITLDCGRIPKALFSARWLKCSSVLGERRREARCWDQQVSGYQGNVNALDVTRISKTIIFFKKMFLELETNIKTSTKDHS